MKVAGVHANSLRRALQFACLPLLAASVSASAQPVSPPPDPGEPVAQYTHNVWQRADGLPQNTVMAIAQTRDRYLWVATQDGLVRFDGVRFTVINTTSTPALRTNDIQALYTDRRGQLWVGTAGGGLLQWNNGRFVVFGAEHGLPNQVVSAIYEDVGGVLWVGTGGGLSRLEAGRFKTYTESDGLADNDVTGITQDAAGALWISTQSGVSRLINGRFDTYRVRNGLPSDDVRAVYTGRDGSIWISTAGGLSRFRDGRFTSYTTKDGLTSSFIRSVFEDRAGTLWIGTVDGGLHRMVEGRITHFDRRQLSDTDVRTIFEDEEGSLWIGTNTGGLNRLGVSQLITYGVPEGLSHDIALGVAADADGDLWVATYGGGVNRLHDGRWSAYSTKHGLSSGIVLSLAPARDGGMWLGTRAGVDRFRDGRFEHLGREVGLLDEPVLALLEDRRGDLWVGTRTGIKRVAAGATTTYTTTDGLRSEIIVAILEARDGRIWVGTQGGGLSVFENGRFRTYSPEEGLPNSVVWTISEDTDGTLWLGTNGSGLVRFRNGRFSAYTTREGLFDDIVYRVIEDTAGHLWMSGSRGLFRLLKRDLEAFDAGTATQIPIVSYGEADGMRSSEANGGIQPAGWRALDGRLWFPSIKGVVLVDPDRLISNRPPQPAIVEEVLVDRDARDPRVQVVGAPGVRSLEFRYTSPSFLRPANIRFRYRLEGYDPNWIEADHRRAAYYTNIPPGDYRFLVGVSYDGAVWNDTGSAVAVRLAPHFTQTPAFYVLCVGGVMLIVGGLHGARVSGLKAREQDLVRLAEERRQIVEALRKSEANFRALFDNVLEGVYQSTPDGRILLANRACAQLLGHESAEEITGANMRDLHVNPDEWTHMATALAETGEVRNLEVLLRRPDGGSVTVLESVRAARDQSGAMVSFEGTLFDITQRKDFEEQIRQLQKMEIVGRLAGGVAHDFNNLITPILGYCDFALEALDADSPVCADIQEIRKAGESAASLTRQLLAFSRQQILEPRVLDLNDVVRHVANILQRLIGEHIRLTLRLDPQRVCVTADPGQIEQVLLNLAVNARDAMPSGGALTIETSHVTLDEDRAARVGVVPGPYVMLKIADTGMGIPTDVQARLFDAFFTTKRHGTGLGLSTVHSIVKKAGGYIQVESAPGQGAAFLTHLPMARDVPKTPELASAEPPAGDETVLLVEDNDALRDLARRTLERGRYRVLPARDGDEAERIEAQHTGEIHLLLTDVVMPGLSGPALAERVRARRPGVRVLFTTGYIDDDTAQHGLLRGSAVLQKPFTPNLLLQKVRDVLHPVD